MLREVDVRSFRVVPVLLLLAVGMLLARGFYGKQITAPGMSAHPQGPYQFPRGDCGDNFFMSLALPGDVCLKNMDSAERVERAMEESDPTIFDDTIDSVGPERWQMALFRALRSLGWDVP